LAPDIMPPDVPPPPAVPPGTSEFGLSEWTAAAHQPHFMVPASPSFGCGSAGTSAQDLSLPDASGATQLLRQLVPFSEAPFTKAPPSPQDAQRQQHLASVADLNIESCAMSRERPLIQARGHPTCSLACSVPSEYDNDISQALALLDVLRSGPSVPPLPPSGCYGGVFVSSAISEGLGDELAAAEAAARGFGDRPVKVMLPWYTAHADIAMFDKTKSAKITMAF